MSREIFIKYKLVVNINAKTTFLQDLAVPFNKPKLQDAVKRLADDQAGRIYFGYL